jgi:voltage-gated potassium channel
VAVERAANVLVCMGRDDTAVLVALTVRALNSDCGLVAVSHEEENVKLLERSGASAVISPALAGGTLMAAATHRGHLVETMQDLLDAGGSMQLTERPVHPGEVGKKPTAIDGAIVLSVYRGGEHLDATKNPTLRSGDTLVLASPRNA